MSAWSAWFSWLFDFHSHLWVVALIVPGAVLVRWLPYGVAFLRGLRHGPSGIDPGLRAKETLEWAYLLRGLFLGLGGLTFLLALAGLGSSLLALGMSHDAPSRLGFLAAGLWALACVLTVWIQVNGIVPWFSPSFREWAWRVARRGGAVWSHLRDIAIWLLLAVTTVAVSITLFLLSPDKLRDSRPLSSLVVLLVLLLLHTAYRARRRIVIQPFADPKGDSPLAGMGIELAARLQHELARIQSLYEVMDEVMPELESKSVGVSMSVEDIGEIFKEAVGPSSTLKLAGFVEIPIGAILSAIGFFVRGPRITGSLFREESADGQSHGFLLLAEISGGGQSGSWQVSFEEKKEVQAVFESDVCDLSDARAPFPQSKQTEGDGRQPAATGPSDAERAELARLVELLACRIFTSLVPSGSPRWQAVRHFTAGLRAYRKTQRTSRRKPFQLHEAEREFLLALGEDNQFARCHCNLGVVYNQMGLKDAEEAALRQALAQDPAAVDAYLGLASLRFHQGQPQSAGRHSVNGLRIDPWHPRLWNLRGLSRLRCPTPELEWKPGDDPAWKECLPFLGIATALAWRQMVREAGSGRPALVDKARRVATICLGNLAPATASAGHLGNARRLFRQALRLSDDPWWLTFELSRTLYLAPAKSKVKRLRLLREAEVALDRVYDEALDRESRIKLDLYWLGTHLALMAADERAGRSRPSLHQPKVEDSYACILDQMALEEWNETRMFQLLEDAEKPLQILGGDATGHFARLRALSRAVPLLTVSCDKPVDKPVYPVQLHVWDKALEWLEEKLKKEELPAWPGQEPGTLSSKALLSSVRNLMQILEVDLPASDDAETVSEWWRRARALWAQRREDWEWLHVQVRLQLARAGLEGQLVDKTLAATAAGNFKIAIERLYAKHEHGLQIRNQWLYRCLAKAYLLETQPDATPTRETLCKALKAGRKAVAWNPQEPTGFLVLGQVYAALGDWRQAREEWEKALSFGTTSEIWLAIAETYLNPANPPSLLGAETDLERSERITFLREGLNQVESRPAGDHDDSWLQAHGAIHLCLGLAQLDLQQASQAIPNLSTACSLGYRPFDARLALAKAHAQLEKRSEVQKDFEAAATEANKLPNAERKAAKKRIHEAREELGVAA